MQKWHLKARDGTHSLSTVPWLPAALARQLGITGEIAVTIQVTLDGQLVAQHIPALVSQHTRSSRLVYYPLAGKQLYSQLNHHIGCWLVAVEHLEGLQLALHLSSTEEGADKATGSHMVNVLSVVSAGIECCTLSGVEGDVLASVVTKPSLLILHCIV